MICSKWVLAGAGSLVILSACGGPGPTPYEELLQLVPDTPQTRSSVFIIDYARVRELFDIPLPGPGADQQAMEEYYNYQLPSSWTEDFPDFAALKATGAARVPYLSDGYSEFRVFGDPLGRNLDARRRQRQYLGFDIRNEDQAMTAGPPPQQLEVLRGRFDPAAFDRALSTCAGECTPPDAREAYQGVTFYGWGKDFETNVQKLFGPPAFDHLGIGGRIALQKNYVFRTLGTDDMRSMIDASLNKRSSLADAEDYRLLAQGMSELGAYGMFFTDQTQGFDEAVKAFCRSSGMSGQDCARVRAELEERQPMLRRYQAFATGVGKDGKGAYTALVLVHADAGSATANVGLLRRRVEEGESLRVRGTWAQYFDTDAMEVHAKGRALLAKLRPTEARQPIWIDWVFQQDPLLLHESAH